MPGDTPMPLALYDTLVVILATLDCKALRPCLFVSHSWHMAGMSPLSWKIRCILAGYWRDDDPLINELSLAGIARPENPWLECYRTPPIHLNMVLIGDRGAGKTSLARALFWGELYHPGAEQVTSSRGLLRIAGFAGIRCRVEALDMPSARTICRADAALVVYDCRSRDQLEGARRALEALRAMIPQAPPHLALGEAVAGEAGAVYRETSAATGAGLAGCFEDLCRMALRTRLAACQQPPPGPESPRKPRGCAVQ
ncbi:hypothetical protein PAPYR_1486 [Paratrimastix pyriformis]|uniref:Uncharacterized protein n=1 Tax=Paratrimastix pyriformis TaxID=342808 RepID=A0ABQ8UVQ1_9EUKA|nr:hypothetical protein PAPYR_1486 [Paratrimastix pyriformis]